MRWIVLTVMIITRVFLISHQAFVVDFDPEFVKEAEVSLYYMDDRELSDPPESEPGQSPGFGYEIDITNIRKGTYSFAVYTFAPQRYCQGDEKAYLNILEHPLQVTVRSEDAV